jgi:acyl carrier protein
MEIVNHLEKILRTDLAADLGKQALDSEEDLIERGIIDSLGIMKLIVSMEETFGIKVNDEDILPENFQNLNAMVKFVEQKMRNK